MDLVCPQLFVCVCIFESPLFGVGVQPYKGHPSNAHPRTLQWRTPTAGPLKRTGFEGPNTIETLREGHQGETLAILGSRSIYVGTPTKSPERQAFLLLRGSKALSRFASWQHQADWEDDARKAGRSIRQCMKIHEDPSGQVPETRTCY